jgi:hypothetical protein
MPVIENDKDEGVGGKRDLSLQWQTQRMSIHPDGCPATSGTKWGSRDQLNLLKLQISHFIENDFDKINLICRSDFWAVIMIPLADMPGLWREEKFYYQVGFSPRVLTYTL